MLSMRILCANTWGRKNIKTPRFTGSPKSAWPRVWHGPRPAAYAWFVRSGARYRRDLARIVSTAAGCPVWVIWPRKDSALGSDLTQAVVRKIGLEAGLVDYKVCRVDDVWSGLKFTVREER